MDSKVLDQIRGAIFTQIRGVKDKVQHEDEKRRASGVPDGGFLANGGLDLLNDALAQYNTNVVDGLANAK